MIYECILKHTSFGTECNARCETGKNVAESLSVKKMRGS